jgi:hypothetical protein
MAERVYKVHIAGLHILAVAGVQANTQVAPKITQAIAIAYFGPRT